MLLASIRSSSLSVSAATRSRFCAAIELPEDKPGLRVRYHKASFRSVEPASGYPLSSDENLHPVGRRFLLMPSHKGSSSPFLMRILPVFYDNIEVGKKDSWAMEIL